MNRFRKLLKEREIIVLDGAMGTMLMNNGNKLGLCSEYWNLEQPDLVGSIHRAYIEAGADVILTNTFGGNRYRLSKHGLSSKLWEINSRAIKIALDQSAQYNDSIIVAGSVGPTGVLIKPFGVLDFEEAYSAFTEQVSILDTSGVDVIWIETMSDLTETKAAIEATKSTCDLPIVVTLSFDTNGHTMMGISPEKAVQFLNEYELSAIGANCGKGSEELVQVIRKMKEKKSDIRMVAKTNAGIPKVKDQIIIYDGTPDIMAQYALDVKNAGASLIGACCGSTPDHIKAMASVLKK